ncbi:hypothetical protein PanWU01x14_136360 [Parasponia andersonii]|uniref:Mediator of RNA polymerase II transcription subunit n=1 Tax=Parasponia andersonii TaxID=3476 RepID=A0A2P5CNW5_PARAD|nr:hypothetical protein PanWU01x14_136360 [Parasponia andersonii]
MDQNQRPSSASRAYQFHPGRAATIINLFDLYLGRGSRQKPDDSTREPPNKTQKRVVALNRELPPRNEQFLSDFEQIQSQFSDQEQLRAVTESVLISLVVQCSSHVPRAEFLLFALRSLCSIGYINWDSFLPSLLSSVSTAEMSAGQGTQAIAAVSSQPGVLPSSNTISNSSNFHSSNPASPLPSVHGIGSPAQSALEPAPCATLSPVKSSDITCMVQQSTRVNSSIRDNAISSLRQLCCKIILAGLDFNLKPVTHADIFSHMLNWLVNWDQRQQGSDEFDGLKSWKPGKALIEWLHSCLDVIWLLVEEDKCRVPFYELLRGGLQFIENIPDDEALFTLILEIHRRRDMMATHMQMLDQHLHCPTFGTQRIFSQITPNVAGEAVSGLRYSPITYPSVLGEPLHGEELATSIQKGSLDWERALRCIRHAFCTTPSPDWWKRVLLVAPCYRLQDQGSTPGAVFSSEMICEGTIDRMEKRIKEINCWQEWRVFSDIFYFLMKSGCIDFVHFVDKLVLRLTEGGDHHILRTNHVTLLIAEIIRIELVINALNTDARKVETTRKILSFHREDRSSDPNSPQGILLDFISSCQNLRIWSLNTSTREYLNSEQLQKGKQIDEWWRQASKGDRMMDYMKMDDRSIGMFWVVSYTMAQPACETVMNWLSSAGVTELLPGSNLQASDSLMVMREVSPLPMSLLSGFSMNMCLKLAYQMEESLFSGQNLAQRNPSVLSKPGVTLLLLEILNYRLLPLYSEIASVLGCAPSGLGIGQDVFIAAVGLSNKHWRCDHTEEPLVLVFPREPRYGVELDSLVSLAKATPSLTTGCVGVRRSHTDLILHKGLESCEQSKKVDCEHAASLGSQIEITQPEGLSLRMNHESRGLSQPLEIGCSQWSSQAFERTGIKQEYGLCTAGFNSGEGLSAYCDIGLRHQGLRHKELGPNDFGHKVESLGVGVPRQVYCAGAIYPPETLLGFYYLQRPKAGFHGKGKATFLGDGVLHEDEGWGAIGLGIWVSNNRCIVDLKTDVLRVGIWGCAWGCGSMLGPFSIFGSEPISDCLFC